MQPTLWGYNNLKKESLKILIIKNRQRGPDLISSTPLETSYSYYWTLTCASALEGEVKFLNSIYNVR